MRILTDAQMAAALQLEIAQWQAGRRKGLIPEPAIKAPRPRWTDRQLRAMLGETQLLEADPAAAEALVMEAIDRAREAQGRP